MSEELTTTRDPWERLDAESSQEYIAFCEYCKMGPSRSLRKVSSHLGTSYDTIKIYSRNHRWVERAKAMDVAANGLVPADVDMSPTETMAFQFAVGKAMLELGVRAINLKKPGTIKVSDAIKLIDKGAEMQRKAQGIDSPGVQININGKGFEAVEEMLLEAFGEEMDDDDSPDDLPEQA